MNNKISNNRKPLAFVVEDNMTMRLLMRESLEQSGFSVREAENGVIALELFEEINPDVILLDIEMPELDGFDTCSALRGHSRGKNTPILMVTGNDDISSVDRAYEVGATDFINKPINWALLGYRVRYMLRAASTYNDLQKSEASNRALLRAIPDVMLQINCDGMLMDYVAGSDDDMNVSSESIGYNINAIMPENIAELTMRQVLQALSTGESQSYEFQIDHEEDIEEFEARVVVSGEDSVLVIVRNITERKQAADKIHQLAYHDTLTGLPNRQFFLDKIDHAIAHSRQTDSKFSVLHIDLDNFKRVNDTLGHTAGDELLKSISERLGACLRMGDSIAHSSIKSAADAGKLSRLGGDEYVVLLTELHNEEDVVTVVRRILASLLRPFSTAGHEFVITASIGVVMYPNDGDDAESLLKNADAATHHVKRSGRNDYKFYTSSLNEKSLQRLSMESQLRKAVARNELELFYQPKINIHTQEIVGVEALIRWNSSELGFVMPSDFIPLAEDTNLIVPIGEWVINTACNQNQSWNNAGIQPISVAVNLSGKQFQNGDISHVIDHAIVQSGLVASQLEVEVTESAIIQNVESTSEILNTFKEMGVSLALDDFGTGYSSLSYLKRFPFDTLKIDRSFVSDMQSDDDCSLISAIIAMAHSLKLTAIAEGVETAEQQTMLQNLGCDQMQGYYYSKPLPVDQITELLLGQGSAVKHISSL